MDQIDEQFLEYMRNNHPYLYDVEMEVRRVLDRSGYGDVSIVLKIQHNQVEYGEILGSSRNKYVEIRNGKNTVFKSLSQNAREDK